MSSLLDTLGGRAAIEVVVGGLWERILADPLLATMFRDVSRVRHEQTLSRYLCNLFAEVPEPWDGRDVEGVHAGMEIDALAFERFLACLRSTLDAAGVSVDLNDAVCDRVASVRDQITRAIPSPVRRR